MFKTGILTSTHDVSRRRRGILAAIIEIAHQHDVRGSADPVALTVDDPNASPNTKERIEIGMSVPYGDDSSVLVHIPSTCVRRRGHGVKGVLPHWTRGGTF